MNQNTTFTKLMKSKEPKEPKEPMEFIYFITEKSFRNKFKVGKTKNNVDLRAFALESGNSDELVIYKILYAPIKAKLETKIHHMLESKKHKREWFNLSYNDVDNIYESLSLYHHIPNNEDKSIVPILNTSTTSPLLTAQQSLNNDLKNIINFISIGKYINPKNNFEVINDNFINVYNVEKYIKVFIDELIPRKVSIKYLVIIIRDILIEKYITNIDICNRNIITMNGKYKMYYYENNNWYFDAGYDKFVTQCIMKLLDQFKYAINEKKIIISKIRYDNTDNLNQYDFCYDDPVLNMVIDYIINKKQDEDRGEFETAYKKSFDNRMIIYDNITKILFNDAIVKNILSAMKTHLYIDEELQKIIKNIHLQNINTQ